MAQQSADGALSFTRFFPTGCPLPCYRVPLPPTSVADTDETGDAALLRGTFSRTFTRSTMSAQTVFFTLPAVRAVTAKRVQVRERPRGTRFYPTAPSP